MKALTLNCFLGSLYGLLSGKDNVIILSGRQDFQVNRVAVLDLNNEIETGSDGIVRLESILVSVFSVSYKKLNEITKEEFLAAGLVDGDLASHQCSIRDLHHVDSNSEVTIVRIRPYLREGRCAVIFEVID